MLFSLWSQVKVWLQQEWQVGAAWAVKNYECYFTAIQGPLQHGANSNNKPFCYSPTCMYHFKASFWVEAFQRWILPPDWMRQPLQTTTSPNEWDVMHKEGRKAVFVDCCNLSRFHLLWDDSILWWYNRSVERKSSWKEDLACLLFMDIIHSSFLVWLYFVCFLFFFCFQFFVCFFFLFEIRPAYHPAPQTTAFEKWTLLWDKAATSTLSLITFTFPWPFLWPSDTSYGPTTLENSISPLGFE